MLHAGEVLEQVQVRLRDARHVENEFHVGVGERRLRGGAVDVQAAADAPFRCDRGDVPCVQRHRQHAAHLVKPDALRIHVQRDVACGEDRRAARAHGFEDGARAVGGDLGVVEPGALARDGRPALGFAPRRHHRRGAIDGLARHGGQIGECDLPVGMTERIARQQGAQHVQVMRAGHASGVTHEGRCVGEGGVRQRRDTCVL